MATDTVDIKARNLMDGVELKYRIRGLTEWNFRVWIGMQLIRLAAWIMWMDVEWQGIE
uniref:Uncharacterized protein n=1 Tax=viral metagenome TaxID=1070528 RepID=A0A6M3M1I0_9ZZZZ